MFSEFFERKKEKMEMKIERYRDLAHGDPVTPHNAIESAVASAAKTVKESSASSGSSLRNFLGRGNRRGSLSSLSTSKQRHTPITRLTFENEVQLFDILKSPLEDPDSKCNSGILDVQSKRVVSTSSNSSGGDGGNKKENFSDSDSEEEEQEPEEIMVGGVNMSGKGYSLRSSRGPYGRISASRGPTPTTSPFSSMTSSPLLSSTSTTTIPVTTSSPPQLSPVTLPSSGALLSSVSTPSTASSISPYSPTLPSLSTPSVISTPTTPISSSHHLDIPPPPSSLYSTTISSTPTTTSTTPTTTTTTLVTSPPTTPSQRTKEVEEASLAIPFGYPITSAYVSTVQLYNDESFDEVSTMTMTESTQTISDISSQGHSDQSPPALKAEEPKRSNLLAPPTKSSLGRSMDFSLAETDVTLPYVDLGAYDLGYDFADDKDLVLDENGVIKEPPLRESSLNIEIETPEPSSTSTSTPKSASTSTSQNFQTVNETQTGGNLSPPTFTSTRRMLAQATTPKGIARAASQTSVPIPTISEPTPLTITRAPVILNLETEASVTPTILLPDQGKSSVIGEPYAYMRLPPSREGSREDSPRSYTPLANSPTDNNFVAYAEVRCTASKPISASSSPRGEASNADEESTLMSSGESDLSVASEPLFFGGFGGQLHSEAEQRLMDANRQRPSTIVPQSLSSSSARFLAGVREALLPSIPAATQSEQKTNGYVLEAETNALSNMLSLPNSTSTLNRSDSASSLQASPLPSPSTSPRMISLSPQSSLTNLVSSAAFKPITQLDASSGPSIEDVEPPSPQASTLRSSTFALPTRRPAPPTPPPSAAPAPPEQKTKRVVALPEVDDWNGRFQRCVRGVRKSYGEQEKLKDSFRKLISVSQDFLHSAKTYGKIIVDERELPEEFKTIKPLPAGTVGMIGGEKYFVANIIFKFALGGPFLKGFTDEIAAKVAGHELKGLLSYYNSGVPGIHVPLIALLDYRGYRLLAISRLPVSGTTLKYGTADGAKTIHNDLSEHQLRRLKKAAEYINIKPHFCRNMHSPCDLEGHIGHDGRFYVLDFSRVLPPVAPVAPGKRIPCAHLYRLFRPEFIQQYPKPLCSDGFSGFIKGLSDADQHNRELLQATRVLLQRVIPETASLLSHKVLECVTFGEALDQFPLVRLIHTQGVNLRYLPLLRFHSHIGKVRGLLMIEMIARTLKQWIRRDTREEMKRLCVPLEAPYKELMLNRLNIIFGNPNSPATSTFWKVTLREMMITKYSSDGPVFLPTEMDMFDLRQYVIDSLEGYLNGMVLLSTKMTSMLKIKLGAMLLKFLQKYPASFNLCDFAPLEEVDIRSIAIRVKHMNLVAHAEGYLLRLRGDDQKIANEPKKAVLLAAYAKLEEALNTDPRNKYTLRNCAIVLFTMYRHLSKHHLLDTPEQALLRKAESYFRDALKIDPKDPFSRYHYAEFLLKTSKEGDPDNERRETEFLKILRDGPSDPLVLGMYYQFLLMHFNSRTEAIKRVHERLNKAMELRARSRTPSEGEESR